jgi:hypothetical protein
MTSDQATSTPSTIWYPENDVLAVVDDAAQVDATITELRAQGVHAEDIQVLHGQEVVDRVDASGAHCGLLKHLMWYVASVFSDEREFARGYEAEGRAGRYLLAVHVHAVDEVEKVRATIGAHGGHEMRFFGHWAITDLPGSA